MRRAPRRSRSSSPCRRRASSAASTTCWGTALWSYSRRYCGCDRIIVDWCCASPLRIDLARCATVPVPRVSGLVNKGVRFSSSDTAGGQESLSIFADPESRFRAAPGSRSNLADPYPLHAVIAALSQYGGSPTAGGADVEAEIGPVDRVPNVLRLPDRLVSTQVGIAGEVRAGIAERGVPERQEPVDVPIADVVVIGIDID